MPGPTIKSSPGPGRLNPNPERPFWTKAPPASQGDTPVTTTPADLGTLSARATSTAALTIYGPYVAAVLADCDLPGS